MADAIDLVTLRHLTTATRAAVDAEQWYPALALALSLPDIAGYLEFGKATGPRYAAWFEKFLGKRYRSEATQLRKTVVYLTGEDCWALRCAFLHQGAHEINKRDQRKLLESVQFLAGPGASHRVIIDGGLLLLSIRDFCDEVCAAVETWSRHAVTVPGAVERAKNMLVMRVLDVAPFTVNGVTFRSDPAGAPAPDDLAMRHKQVCSASMALQMPSAELWKDIEREADVRFGTQSAKAPREQFYSILRSVTERRRAAES